MIRKILWLLVFVLVGWFIRGLLRMGKSAPRNPAGTADKAIAGGEMVRDRVCNTFLPRSRALSLSQGGQEHFFCSESCRSAFLEDEKAIH